jgi:hypothetical protein
MGDNADRIESLVNAPLLIIVSCRHHSSFCQRYIVRFTAYAVRPGVREPLPTACKQTRQLDWPKR